MAYKLSNFLVTVSSSDKNLHIRNSLGVVKWMISAYDINSMLVVNNIVKIKLTSSNNIIDLDFDNKSFAKTALSSIQEQCDILRAVAPKIIDSKISNYIESKLDEGGLYGTSSTYLEITSIGSLINLYTQPNLDFKTGQYVKVSNGVESFYVEDDYYDEGDSPKYFQGTIEFYNISSGELSVLNEYTNSLGSTFSTWYINLGGASSVNTNDHFIPSVNNTYDLGSTSSTWRNLYINDIFASANSIYLGGLTLSSSNNSLIVNSINLGTTISPVILSASGSNLYLNNLSISGVTGSTGPSGSDGATGSIGPTGPIGPTPSISTPGNNYMIVSDGSYELIGRSNLTFDNNILSVSATSSLNGHTIFQQTSEVINVIGSTDSVINYDFNSGAIWHHGIVESNFTANFTNIPTTDNRSITATIIISQSSVAYSPNVVMIDGVAKTIKWAGGTYSASADKIDIVGFSFIRINSDWSYVFGQINSFS
jgi:hypothetical protein